MYVVVYSISVRKLRFNAVAILSTEIDNLVRILFRTLGETMGIVRWEQQSLLVGWHDSSELPCAARVHFNIVTTVTASQGLLWSFNSRLPVEVKHKH